MIDRAGLADFLRVRRAALQPEDVGLPRGQRRRTGGLRREEVAALSHMSTDYYSRLERERGPQPSPQMIAAIAQGLHLSREERNHLFLLAGHQPPMRGSEGEHVSPGMMRIFDRLTDTPAEIVTNSVRRCARTDSESHSSATSCVSTVPREVSDIGGSPIPVLGGCILSRTTSSIRACTFRA